MGLFAKALSWGFPTRKYQTAWYVDPKPIESYTTKDQIWDKCCTGGRLLDVSRWFSVMRRCTWAEL